MRSNYWSCSKFADWIRGIKKGSAKTGRGWREWEQEGKAKYPIRFWIAEEALDAIQNFIWWPVDRLHDIKYYINNRWVTRTHSLTAHPRDIKPGQWQDVGNRFLPCLFNELVDFVEVELAWWHLAWSPEERPKYNMPWWAVGWWRIRIWRCPQAGLDNLEWQRKLVWNEDELLDKDDPRYGKPTRQAVNAQEILDLYTWWTKVYPNRPDPHDAGGWTAVCNRRREKNGGDGMSLFDSDNETPAEKRETMKALKLSQKIEDQYNKEDEAMMIRLIKIRQSLWT